MSHVVLLLNGAFLNTPEQPTFQHSALLPSPVDAYPPTNICGVVLKVRKAVLRGVSSCSSCRYTVCFVMQVNMLLSDAGQQCVF